MSTKRLPLEGVRVTDFTWALAGGQISMTWAMLGAEVIKVETGTRAGFVGARHRDPNAPRYSPRRAIGGLDDLRVNKRSIKLNLKEPRAIDLVKRLASVSDMVGENFRPGVMDRLGLGYEDLKKVKTSLVYLSQSANGNYGPDKFDPGFASVFAYMSGFSSLWGYEGGAPTCFHLPSDLSSGAMGAFVSIAALAGARRTGVGQHIDLANREVLASFVGDAFLEYGVNGRIPGPVGNRHPRWAPHNVYRCGGEHDGGRWIAIVVKNDEEWQGLVKVMGRPAWALDARFATVDGRQRHQAEMDEKIEAWTRTRNDFELMEQMQRAGVAATPVAYPEDLIASPHLAAQKAFKEIREPDGKSTLWFGAPWKFSKTPCDKAEAPPEMGEGTRYVLMDLLGLSEAEVRKLSEENVIA